MLTDGPLRGERFDRSPDKIHRFRMQSEHSDYLHQIVDACCTRDHPLGTNDDSWISQNGTLSACAMPPSPNAFAGDCLSGRGRSKHHVHLAVFS